MSFRGSQRLTPWNVGDKAKEADMTGLALDERAVEDHVRDGVSNPGGVDVSFNLISRGDVQGTLLVEMTAAPPGSRHRPGGDVPRLRPSGGHYGTMVNVMSGLVLR
jgi:hypothetical protein